MVAFLLVIGAATITLDFSIRQAWENSLRAEIETSLLQKTKLLAQRVESEKGRPLQEIAKEVAQASNARATVIDSTGRVLADSEADPATMENHATRPEFIDAFKKQEGDAIRHSRTVGIDFLYVAVPIQGGAVRLAYPLSSIHGSTSKVRTTLLESSALALLLATIIAWFAAQSISTRLQRIVRFA